jgi:hypothetical protein
MVCRDVDAHIILGVPHTGAEIELGQAVPTSLVRMVRKLLLIRVISYPISMSELREVLLKDYGTGMSYEQRASIKIAAVLYAITCFLAPNCCRPKFTNTEVLKHILDADRIKNVNWAGYIIKCIKRVAARLKDELCNGTPSVIIHGCPAMLQVLPTNSIIISSNSVCPVACNVNLF